METDVKETRITYIHESIIIRILCFLPAGIVVRCRAVCKNWDTLISSPCFAEAYSSSGTAPLQFLLHGTLRNRFEHLLLAHHASASSNSPDCPSPVTKSVLPNIFGCKSSSDVTICSVCNFTGFVVAYVGFNEPYHLFNPITRQHIVVQHNGNNGLWVQCALLLAHKTNQLKLFRAFSGATEGEIQTVGTGLLRKIRVGRWFYSVTHSGFPCFLNGYYHWYGRTWNHVIICFNPEEEIFHEIPGGPPYMHYSSCSKLGLLDGCLCICTRGIFPDHNSYEFFVMNEYGVSESWTKKFVISHGDVQKLRMKCILEPLLFQKNGEIMVQSCENNLIGYDPITGDHKSITYLEKDRCHLNYWAIPYVPNFKRVSTF